jgi:hypothetical protein
MLNNSSMPAAMPAAFIETLICSCFFVLTFIRQQNKKGESWGKMSRKNYDAQQSL